MPDDRGDPLAGFEPSGHRLLVIEDDRDLREMLGRMLTKAGYAVELAGDGQTGLHKSLTGGFDALIVDRGLPVIDGLDLIRRLRRQGLDAPALVLTAYGDSRDMIAGLDAGAEDYVVKPFEIDVLLARIRALLRRTHSRQTSIPLGAATLDVMRRVVTVGGGREIELSGRESALLRVLAASPNRVFSRDELKARVFDSAESESIVDTYVHYLRRKVGSGVISTVRGLGYRAGRL
jgi:two-component system, OmpR family, response regulator